MIKAMANAPQKVYCPKDGWPMEMAMDILVYKCIYGHVLSYFDAQFAPQYDKLDNIREGALNESYRR